MSRGDGGIRLAVCLHLLSFCETAGGGIRLEPRSHLKRLRDRRGHIGAVLARARPVDRPPWPSPHHSHLHDAVWMRHCLIVAVALRIMAVLPDLFRVGRGWQWCGTSGLFAIDFHLVSATAGDRVGLCHGRSGLGRDDFAGHRPIHHQPVWLAQRLRITRWSGIVAGLAAQLALHPRTWGKQTQVSSGPAVRNDMAARPALFCFLDCHCHPVCEFDQHERGDHSSVCVADRSRPQRGKCGTMRVTTRRIEPAGQDRSGMAA